MKTTQTHAKRVEDREEEFITHVQKILDESTVSPARALKTAKIFARRYLAAGELWPHVRFLFLCAEQSFYLGRIEDMEKYIERARTFETQLRSAYDRGRYLCQIGTYYATKGQIGEAYTALSQCLRLLEPIEPEGHTVGQALNCLAMTFGLAGQDHTALEYYLRSRKVFEAIGHHQGVGVLLREMGVMYLKTQRVDNARECFEQSIELHRSAGNHVNLAAAVEAIGRLYLNHGQPQQALELFEESLALYRDLRMPHHIGDLLCCIADAHCQLDNDSEAMRYAQMVLDTASSEDQWGERVRTSATMVLALLHYRAGDAGTARSIMEPMMEAAEALGDLSFSAEVHRLLAEILEALGELGASLDHYKRHLDFYAQVHNAERQQAFAEVEKRHALMEAIRKQEQLELRATLAEQESRQKEQELRSLATTILRRNEALKHLRSVVQTRSQNTVGREARDLAAVVLENIDAAFEDREEWTVFEKEFERVHHDFVKSLRDRCSLLTPTEIRVCILTRLGLPNKQIADSLFISGVTVKTHRRHIRRKLGLATDGNLTSLILSI